MSFPPFITSSLDRKGSLILDPFLQVQPTGTSFVSSGSSFSAPQAGYGFPSTSPSLAPTGTATYSGTTYASYPMQSQVFQATSSAETSVRLPPSPLYSSIGSFSVQTSSPSQQGFPQPDTKSYSPTYFALPPPALPSSPRLPPSSPVRGLLSPTSSPGRPSLGSPPRQSPSIPSSPILVSSSSPLILAPSPVRGFSFPSSSPTRGFPSSSSSPKGERKVPSEGRYVENRDFSEWGINFKDFDTSLLSSYSNRFLLTFKRRNGKYKAVWAPGRLLRGDLLLGTAREAKIATITGSPLIDGYPTNLDSDSVIAAISPLDEQSVAKYLSMGDTTINLLDLLDYLNISRLIGDKPLVDALVKDLKALGEFEKNSSTAEMKYIGEKMSAGLDPLQGAVSRVVGEKVNIPLEYILPRSTGSREDFISAFRGGVRAHPIVTGTFADDSKENHDDLISILNNYKVITPGLFRDLLSSGKHPRLIRTPTLWKHLGDQDLREAMSSLSHLEASDVLSVPLKEVDPSAPYIFNLDEVPRIAQNMIATLRGRGTYPTTDEMVRMVGRYLYVDEEKHGEFDTTKLDRLLIELPLENSAITGSILGSLYSASLTGSPEMIADTFPRSKEKYSLVPVTSDQFGEEKAAYATSFLESKDGEERLKHGGIDYFLMKGSGLQVYFRYTWASPLEIVNWASEGQFHETAKKQITYLTSIVPSTKYILDEMNNVYYVWDEDYLHRPWLIYRATTSDVFRSSLPAGRILLIKDDDGKLQGYTSASLISYTIDGRYSPYWYYNPRPGVDRSDLYEPISTLLTPGRVEISAIMQSPIISRLYKGKTYVLSSFTFSPFFKPLPAGAPAGLLVLYRDIFPGGFPAETDPDTPPVSYEVPRTSLSDVKLEKAPLAPLSALTYLEVSTASPLGTPPDSKRSSLGTVLPTVRKQTPPSITSVSPVRYVTDTSQFPSIPTGVVPAKYVNPMDFTSSKQY